MKLTGKTGIITGGASGLGEGTMRRFAGAGANVAIFDMNEERGSAIAAELGDHVRFFQVDVTDETSVADAVAGTMDAFGAIHIACNFAGIVTAAKTVGKDGPFPLDLFKKTIDVNLIGTFNVLRLAAVEMAKNDPSANDGERGVIINTASVAGYEGQVGQAAYSASKGAIIGLTLPVARDLASLQIRCNTIAPGIIHTPLFDSLPDNVVEGLSNSVLNPKRLGTPDEIAQTAQYMVENAYLNGETIRVDGGIRMQPR